VTSLLNTTAGVNVIADEFAESIKYKNIESNEDSDDEITEKYKITKNEELKLVKIKIIKIFIFL
jgi:hypothetical protein